MSSRSAIAIVLAWTGAVHVAADDWPAPRIHNVFSDNGRYFVRVVPGTSTGDTVGFAGSSKGPYARGEFYERKPDRSYQLVADVALQNPVSPTDALVTNGGCGTFTFDLRAGAFDYHPGRAECRPPTGPFSAFWFGK